MADLNDADRLLALRNTGLLDTPPEASFDRLTRLASRILRVPISLISLVDANRQFFKSQVGLPDPYDVSRQTPLSHSFCQQVVTSEDVLLVRDATADPRVSGNLAVRDLKVMAYVGVPLRMPDGSVLGSLCAIDHVDRDWTAEDVAALGDLGELVMQEIALRFENAKTRENERQGEHADELPLRLKASREALQSILDTSTNMATQLGHFREAILKELSKIDKASS